MRDVLLAGIYDADIRREMYGIDQILQQPVNAVIAIVEKKGWLVMPSQLHLPPQYHQ